MSVTSPLTRLGDWAYVAGRLSRHDCKEGKLESVGGRLRYFRKFRGLTMAELAAAVHCSESFISKIEAGKASPSLNMLHRISQVLSTNIGELFSANNDVDGVVLKQGERPIIEHPLRKGRQITLERLLTPDGDNLLQANLHHLEPEAASEGLIVHAGEEFGYVLEGRVELTVGERHYNLDSGDTFHFSSEQPHGYRNIGSGVAKILWVNTPPTY